jgi:MAF protein
MPVSFSIMPPLHFVLASQSPRRRQLLGTLPYPHSILVPEVDEDLHLDQDPAIYVQRTARQKAEVAAGQIPTPSTERLLIVAADTTVALAGEIMGKPGSGSEAREMLIRLRGRTHQVHTGLCLIDRATGREIISVHSAEVTMRDYTMEEISRYVATGDPMDKAGAYAIQHPEFRPVARLDGCYLAVMGFSLCDLINRLAEIEIEIAFDRAALVKAHQGYACPVLEHLGRP